MRLSRKKGCWLRGYSPSPITKSWRVSLYFFRCFWVSTSSHLLRRDDLIKQVALQLSSRPEGSKAVETWRRLWSAHRASTLLHPLSRGTSKLPNPYPPDRHTTLGFLEVYGGAYRPHQQGVLVSLWVIGCRGTPASLAPTCVMPVSHDSISADLCSVQQQRVGRASIGAHCVPWWPFTA